MRRSIISFDGNRIAASASRAGALFVFLALLLCSGRGFAQQGDIEWDRYYRAVDYCRGDVPRPLALNADEGIVCLDGRIEENIDVSSVTNLREGGLFVVRSPGGDIAAALAFSNFIRGRRATVVVYGYCLSACANYVLIAPDRTIVLKDALVAWDYESSDPAFPSCSKFAFEKTRDGGFRLQRGSCRPEPGDQAEYRAVLSEQTRFFRERMVDPRFEPPPDNLYIRRALRNLDTDAVDSPHVAWTLHQRYFSRLFKAKIVYEAYPTWEEADALAARLPLKLRLIYDP